jgi:hypothetical protein
MRFLDQAQRGCFRKARVVSFRPPQKAALRPASPSKLPSGQKLKAISFFSRAGPQHLLPKGRVRAGSGRLCTRTFHSSHLSPMVNAGSESPPNAVPMVLDPTHTDISLKIVLTASPAGPRHQARSPPSGTEIPCLKGRNRGRYMLLPIVSELRSP